MNQFFYFPFINISYFLLFEFFIEMVQLTDNEKKKLITFLEFKNNLSKILEAIKLGIKNFAKPLNFFNFGNNHENASPKKWVRNDKNDNIKV